MGLQKLHKEIQSFASVILSYDWDTTIGVSGSVDQTFRVCSLEYNENLELGINAYNLLKRPNVDFKILKTGGLTRPVPLVVLHQTKYERLML